MAGLGYFQDQKKLILYIVRESPANNYDRQKSVFVRLEVCAEEVECGEAVRNVFIAALITCPT